MLSKYYDVNMTIRVYMGLLLAFGSVFANILFMDIYHMMFHRNILFGLLGGFIIIYIIYYFHTTSRSFRKKERIAERTIEKKDVGLNLDDYKSMTNELKKYADPEPKDLNNKK